MSIMRQPDPKGDRVNMVLSGKFSCLIRLIDKTAVLRGRAQIRLALIFSP